jgi:hypothetical protein
MYVCIYLFILAALRFKLREVLYHLSHFTSPVMQKLDKRIQNPINTHTASYVYIQKEIYGCNPIENLTGTLSIGFSSDRLPFPS